MATEHDLSDLLPPNPLPRPAGREEAIGAAMRRFDGGKESRQVPASRRPWIMSRPQLGGLVTAALIAVIGLPMWLSGDRTPPVSSTIAATDTVPPPRSSAATKTVAEAASDSAERPSATASPAANPDTQAAVSGTVHNATEPSMTAGEFSDRFAENAAPASAQPPPPPPPAASAMAMGDEADDANIVVTGSRITGREKARAQIASRYETAGVWNACTVADPRQDLAACRRLSRAGAPAEAGQSAALVGEGLSRAWRDDDAGAIAAFDKAIALAPRSGSAWLNRGLAHAKNGDNENALADLNKAVRYAPNDARTWAQRSLILRRAGKTARADADAAHAIRLAPAIDKLFE